MYVTITIAVPYSIKEIFNAKARERLSELRSVALESYNGDREMAWRYLCRPRIGWGDERSLFEQSLSSRESHERALDAIGQSEYGTCP